MTRWRLIPLAASAVLALAAGVVPALAGAATHAAPTPIAGGQALSGHHPVLAFHGSFSNPTPLPMVSAPLPTACATYCQQFDLKVATRKPFLVSVKNANGSMDDGINLFVNDPSGKQVGAADGIGANGQAIAVSHAVPGVYKVSVTLTYAYDPQTKYAGEARIMAGRTWQHISCKKKRCPLLPRLQALPPSDLHITGLPPVASTPVGFPFPFNVPTNNSCYTDETVTMHAKRCLRFTSDVENVGAGQLHLRLDWLTTSGGQPQSGFLPGECHAEQIIDMTDGSTTTRPAGTCEFHPQHGHFHYKAFVGYGLYAVTKSGHTGKLVVRSQKESFCLADDNYAGFGKRSPNGPRRYAGQPGCNIPAAPSSSDVWVSMGVDPGWGDVYTWDTPDQFIDVSGVPNGTYDIVIEANPSGLMRVAGPARTCSATRIKLTATSVKALSSRPSVRCPT